MANEKHTCTYCQLLIETNGYYSRQVGMKGHYHWNCFIKASKQKTEIGTKKIPIVIPEGNQYT